MFPAEVKLPAHWAGLPGHVVASRMRANEISFFIVPINPLGLSTHWASQPIEHLNPLSILTHCASKAIGPLNPAYKAGLAGHLPAINEIFLSFAENSSVPY